MAYQFGIVILAAGGSARLGRPKQLLPYEGKTLVEHCARTCLASGAAEIVLVLGSQAQEIRSSLPELPIKLIKNKEWVTGMGGSIRCGIEALGRGIDCSVIVLVDQPRITARHLYNLAQKHYDNRTQIVASLYDGVLGVPCAFHKSLFPELTRLSGESGAKEFISNFEGKVDSIELGDAAFDVDSQADYEMLIDS